MLFNIIEESFFCSTLAFNISLAYKSSLTVTRMIPGYGKPIFSSETTMLSFFTFFEYSILKQSYYIIYQKIYFMQNATEPTINLTINSLCQEAFPPNAPTICLKNSPQLFNHSKHTIAGISVQTTKISIFLFNLSARKSIYKKLLHNELEFPSQVNVELILLQQETKQHVIIVRKDDHSFLFFSLRLQVLHKLNLQQEGSGVACLRYSK